MSIALMTKVWDSDLPGDEKFVALALADWANDDGTDIYPSLDRIGKKVSKSGRAVFDTMKKLEARGVIIADPDSRGGGKSRTVRWTMIVAAIPYPEDSSGLRNHEVPANHEVSDIVTMKPTSNDPSSGDPSDPSLPTPLTPQQEQVIKHLILSLKQHLAIPGTRTPAMDGLVRLGMTVGDIDVAISAAKEKGAGSAYAMTIIERRVQERRAGHDPDDQGNGGGVAGSAPRAPRRGAGRGGGPAGQLDGGAAGRGVDRRSGQELPDLAAEGARQRAQRRDADADAPDEAPVRAEQHVS